MYFSKTNRRRRLYAGNSARWDSVDGNRRREGAVGEGSLSDEAARGSGEEEDGDGGDKSEE